MQTKEAIHGGDVALTISTSRKIHIQIESLNRCRALGGLPLSTTMMSSIPDTPMVQLARPKKPGGKPEEAVVVAASLCGQKRARSLAIFDMTTGDADDGLDMSLVDALGTAISGLKEGAESAMVNTAVRNAERAEDGRRRSEIATLRSQYGEQYQPEVKKNKDYLEVAHQRLYQEAQEWGNRSSEVMKAENQQWGLLVQQEMSEKQKELADTNVSYGDAMTTFQKVHARRCTQ